MAIIKFDIVKAPLRSVINIEGVAMVLNKEYSILKQSAFDVISSGVGVPYDSFEYRLCNSEGVWSQPILATVNVEVDSGTPSASLLEINVSGNDLTDITSSITVDQYTDRVMISLPTVDVPFYGKLYVNNVLLEFDKSYFLYELGLVQYVANGAVSLPSVQTQLRINRGNKDNWSGYADFYLKHTDNLFGVIETSSVVTGTLTAA